MRRENLKEKISYNLEQFVMPLIHRLRRKSSADDKKYIDLLEIKLKALTSAFGVKISQEKWKLTAREIEICEMIKNGSNTKEIADLLCTSIRTVEHHRNHIRKKMGVSRDVDLQNFLINF